MNFVSIKCTGCKISFLKTKSEYNRQLKKGKNNFYCSSACCGKHASNSRIKHSNIDKKCLFCEKIFSSTTHKGSKKCCSNGCARKYSQTFVDTKNQSMGLKNYFKNNPRKKSYLTCEMCNIHDIKIYDTQYDV